MMVHALSFPNPYRHHCVDDTKEQLLLPSHPFFIEEPCIHCCCEDKGFSRQRADGRRSFIIVRPRSVEGEVVRATSVTAEPRGRGRFDARSRPNCEVRLIFGLRGRRTLPVRLGQRRTVGRIRLLSMT